MNQFLFSAIPATSTPSSESLWKSVSVALNKFHKKLQTKLQLPSDLYYNSSSDNAYKYCNAYI